MQFDIDVIFPQRLERQPDRHRKPPPGADRQADLTKYSATYEMPLLYPDLAQGGEQSYRSTGSPTTVK